MARQGKTRHDTTRQKKRKEKKQDETRRDETKPEKTRRDKTQFKQNGAIHKGSGPICPHMIGLEELTKERLSLPPETPIMTLSPCLIFNQSMITTVKIDEDARSPRPSNSSIISRTDNVIALEDSWQLPKTNRQDKTRQDHHKKS
jgi:hypothetical protein